MERGWEEEADDFGTGGLIREKGIWENEKQRKGHAKGRARGTEEQYGRANRKRNIFSSIQEEYLLLGDTVSLAKKGN